MAGVASRVARVGLLKSAVPCVITPVNILKSHDYIVFIVVIGLVG